MDMTCTYIHDPRGGLQLLLWLTSFTLPRPTLMRFSSLRAWLLHVPSNMGHDTHTPKGYRPFLLGNNASSPAFTFVKIKKKTMLGHAKNDKSPVYCLRYSSCRSAVAIAWSILFQKKSYGGCCVTTQKVHARSGYCHVLGPSRARRPGWRGPASQRVHILRSQYETVKILYEKEVCLFQISKHYTKEPVV